MKRWMLLLLGCFGLASACSNDDAGSGSRYPGVERWECYSKATECYCVGLGANDDFGTDDPPAPDCSTYSFCYAYEYLGWECACRANEFEPPADWENPMRVDSCPPE